MCVSLSSRVYIFYTFCVLIMRTSSINTLSKYTPLIRALYRVSPCQMPIQQWVDVVGSHMSIVDHDDIYEPIELRIKGSGRLGSTDGLFTVNVDASDAAWYQTVRHAVAHCMSLGKDAVPHITLHTMRGDDIKTWTPEELHHAGQLSVRLHDKEKRVGSLLEPPAHVRSDKLQDLNSWYEHDVRERIVHHVADRLVGSTMATLDSKTRRGAPLIDEIQSIVEESVPNADMDAFMRTYGINDRAKNTSGSDAAARIARSIMSQVRRGLQANTRRIKAYHAEQIARRVAAQKARKTTDEGTSLDVEDEANMDKPLFETEHVSKMDLKPVTQQDTENDRTLYTKVVRSALGRSNHASKIVYMIYRATPTTQKVNAAPDAQIACHASKGKGKPMGYHQHRHHHHHHHHHHNKRRPDTMVVATTTTDNDDEGSNPYYDKDSGVTVITLDKDLKKRVNMARKFQQYSGRHVFMKPQSRQPNATPHTSPSANARSSSTYDPLSRPMPAPIPLHNGRAPLASVPQFVPYQRNTPIAFSLKPESTLSDNANNVSSSEDDDDDDVSNIFVPWETPVQANTTIDRRVQELEAQLARDEKLLEQKLWKDTHRVATNTKRTSSTNASARPKTLPNGMPSIFAFMDE